MDLSLCHSDDNLKYGDASLHGNTYAIFAKFQHNTPDGRCHSYSRADNLLHAPQPRRFTLICHHASFELLRSAEQQHSHFLANPIRAILKHSIRHLFTELIPLVNQQYSFYAKLLSAVVKHLRVIAKPIRAFDKHYDLAVELIHSTNKHLDHFVKLKRTANEHDNSLAKFVRSVDKHANLFDKLVCIVGKHYNILACPLCALYQRFF